MKNELSIKEVLIQLMNRLDNIQPISPDWLTPDQLANYIGLSKNTIYQYVHRNQIPYYKIPKSTKLVFRKKEIDFWIEGKVSEQETSPNKIVEDIWKTIR